MSGVVQYPDPALRAQQASACARQVRKQPTQHEQERRAPATRDGWAEAPQDGRGQKIRQDDEGQTNDVLEGSPLRPSHGWDTSASSKWGMASRAEWLARASTRASGLFRTYRQTAAPQAKWAAGAMALPW